MQEFSSDSLYRIGAKIEIDYVLQKSKPDAPWSAGAEQKNVWGPVLHRGHSEGGVELGTNNPQDNPYPRLRASRTWAASIWIGFDLIIFGVGHMREFACLAAGAITRGRRTPSKARRTRNYPFTRTRNNRSSPPACSIAISPSARATMLGNFSPHSTSTSAPGCSAISSSPSVNSSRSVSSR
jgi:hypothetical protein